jgi:FAD/FMN-containing dehydrogenase
MLSDTAIAHFEAQLSGNLIRPGGPRYDEARKVFNGMIDRRPAMIAQCATVSDVTESVTLARETGMEVAVRGGGHGVTGNAVSENGLVIDLSAMKGIRVDPGRRIATAEGGATWGVFDSATQAVGLATTGGIVPSTGIAGLTLGGGIGYLNRKYGLACDNLRRAEFVTSDG